MYEINIIVGNIMLTNVNVYGNILDNEMYDYCVSSIFNFANMVFFLKTEDFSICQHIQIVLLFIPSNFKLGTLLSR